MTDAPEVLSTTTVADTPVDAAPAPEELPTAPAVEDAPTDPGPYVPNTAALAAAAGDPTVWGNELRELIGHTTGKWFEAESLTSWLTSFAAQVTQATFRSAMFQVANTTMPSNVKGDPAVELLALRDDLASGFRHSAGL